MLLILVAVHTAPSPQAVPLAGAFLQSCIAADPEAAVIETGRADFYLGQNTADCVDELISRCPAAVGFSMYVWNRAICLEMANGLRRRAPGITIFAGGPEATADPGGVLADTGFDFLIAGEGETAIVEVVKRLSGDMSTSGIPGVATRSGTGICLSKAAPVDNLDSIPSPWLNGILDANYYPGILWQLSRGCSFSCDFCFDSRGRHGVRRFSMARIESELRHFSTCRVSQVFVLDSTFNQDTDRAKKILRLIRKIAPGIHFHFEVRSEFIDREMADLFASITCSLQIGLQSADPGVLKRVGRSFRRDVFSSRVMLLNDAGATFGFDLIYGLPGDTLSGFRDTLDFALSLYPNHLDIFPLAVLPGTALSGRSAGEGLQHLPAPPYTVTGSPDFSGSDMAEAHRLAAACDIFYTRGRAVAWFNSVLDVLGMGASDFLKQFADWLEKENCREICEADLNDEQVWQLQRNFLTGLFGSKKRKRFLPVVLDLVDYHYHYAAALMTPLPDIPSGKAAAKIRALDMPLILSPSARLVEFSCEILEILDAGAPDVRALADELEQTGSQAVIYAKPRGICTEPVDICYFNLLKLLDGQTPAVSIIKGTGLSAAQAKEFLNFALSEGIVLPSGSGEN